MAAALRLRFDRRLMVGVVGVVLLAGLTGFGLKYHSFFRKGATSVVARFDYWSAAIQTAQAHPLVGTGPGTFSRPYQLLKRPESEMARLAHNDFLEQASDSGWVGFLTYTGFIIGSLLASFPRWRSDTPPLGELPGRKRRGLRTILLGDDWLPFSIWLGTLAWATQGLLEFGLYIPALSWTAFCFIGLLVGGYKDSKLVDNPPRSR
jgi:O-antigen ligase